MFSFSARIWNRTCVLHHWHVLVEVFTKTSRKVQPAVFPPPVFLNLWPETQHESRLNLRWFILLACCVDS